MSHEASHWPNLFVVGVARAGTSSLASTLGQHPDIFMSHLKEPYFFSDVTMRYQPFPKDARAYLELFHDAGDARWRGEASTAYFWDTESAARISDASPNARIIISLRDPVTRAYSGYWHAVGNGVETRSFGAVVEEELAAAPRSGEAPGHVRVGHYLPNVERFFRVFGDRCHVLFFEDLVRDPRAQLLGLLNFLDLDPVSVDSLAFESLNASRAPRLAVLRRLLGARSVRAIGGLVPEWLRSRSDTLVRGTVPPIGETERKLLENLYEPERERLEALLGRSVPW